MSTCQSMGILTDGCLVVCDKPNGHLGGHHFSHPAGAAA